MLTKILLFDLDGTLVDSSEVHYRTWVQAMAEVGVSLSKEQFEGVAGLDSYAAANALLPEALKERLGRVVDAKRRAYRQSLDSVRPRQGARRAVETARTLGVRTGIVTSAAREDLTAAMEQVLDFSNLIDVSVSVEDVGMSKPAPALLLTAIEELNGSCQNTLYVGDAQVDMEMACLASVAGIGIGLSENHRARLLAAGASQVIRSLEELGDLLHTFWPNVTDSELS